MDAIEEIKQQIRAQGFTFEPIFDGGWHKIRSSDNQPIRGRYATRVFESGAILTIMSWDEEYKQTFKSTGDIDPTATKYFEKEFYARVKAEKKKENDEASAKAQDDLSKLIPIKSPTPYMDRKKIPVTEGVLVDPETKSIMHIPCSDISGKVWGYQKIYASGDKLFLENQKKEETFFQFGRLLTKLYICEGFATAASVYLATNEATICAWDAPNLKKVAKIFREKYKFVEIIIAGDNDQSETGQNSARAAAELVGGKYIWPDKVDTDWNDLLVESGVSTLIEIFNNILPPKKSLQIISMGNLLVKPDPKYAWCIDQTLITGGMSQIAGPPKSGKSTISRKMALAVSRGDKFFGRDTQQGNVLYIAVEEKLPEVKKHFNLLGAKSTDPVFIHVSYTPHNLVEQIQELSLRLKPNLIICDTLTKVSEIEDINDSVKVNDALSPFHDLAADIKCHFLFVHHTVKGKLGWDSLAGSFAIRGAMDSNMLLEVTETKGSKRVFSSEQRYGLDFDRYVIDFDKQTKDPSLGMAFDEFVEGDTFQQILDMITEAQEPLSASYLATELKKRKHSILMLVKRGIESGKLVRIGKGENSKIDVNKQVTQADSF